MKTASRRSARAGQRGSAAIEFAALSIVIIPLLFGTVSVGVNMGTMVQAVQVSRDVAHMYARGIDFSQTANQNIAVALAPNSNMTTSGGNGVIVLSQITQVYQADCDAAGLTCTNLGQTVFTNRIVIGNSSLTSSRYGTPAAAIVDGAGNIAAADYLTNTTAVATGFSSILTASGYTMADGDVIYLCETYLSTPNLSFLGTQASNGVYAQSIF